MDESKYQIPAKYHQEVYPANPNGSDFNAAMLCSDNGRHLVMMPHLERSTFPGIGHITRKTERINFLPGSLPLKMQSVGLTKNNKANFIN